MKYATRVLPAAMAVAMGILTVPVESQDRVRGAVRVAADTPRALRDWDSRLVRLERAGELRARKTEPDTMIPGRLHERLDRYYKGVPVFGADVARQVRNGETLSLYGGIYPGIDLDVSPTISPEAAIAAFEREIGRPASPAVKPQLIVLPKDDGSYVLAYRMSQYTRLSMPVVFLDARTGEVQLRYDNLQRQTAAIGRGRGVLGDDKKVSAALMSAVYVTSDEMRPPQLLTFDLKGNIARAEGILDGWINPGWSDVGTDTDNDWGDPAIVDAHTYMGFTYDYFYKRFGRKGLDDRDAPIRVIIHGLRREDSANVSSDDYYTYLVNAFWCGSCGSDGRGYAYFGDGNRPGYYDRASGQKFNFLAGALDAVAHELAHGLTGYTSRLIYRNESGALSEAFSDVMSAGAEFYFQSAGPGPMKPDYIVGEDVVTPGVPGSPTGLRSLADPGAFDDPDHYAKRYTGAGDNGGVHTNGLIGGHAFYLAIEGGVNRTSGLAVQGVGAANREQIEKIFYRAFAYYLTSSATFSSARAATIRAAQELYGAGSAAERAITQAWDAVGVK